MPNSYYNFTSEFVPGTMVRASSLNAQFQAVEAAFDEVQVEALGLAVAMPADFEGVTQIPLGVYPSKIVWVDELGNVDLLDVDTFLKRDGSNAMTGHLVVNYTVGEVTSEAFATTDVGVRIHEREIVVGTGEPNGAVAAPQGSLAVMTDGLATRLYVKQLDASLDQDINWTQVPLVQYLLFACSDEETPLTTGQKIKFRIPPLARWAVVDVHGSLNVAQASGSLVTVDVKRNGTSIFGVDKLTFDNNEETTATAATDPAPFGTFEAVLEGGDVITVEVTGCDGSTAACGLKITFEYFQAGPDYVSPQVRLL